MSGADPFRFSTIAHAGRPLLGPLAAGSVDALLAHVAPAARPGARPRVLDIGCGKGEVLVRAMERLDAEGIGVEPNVAFLAEAQTRAAAAGVADRLELRPVMLDRAHLEPGAHDLVICTGAAHAFGDLDAALAGMARLARGDGWALLGHGYWQREPAAEYLAAFGGSAGEMATLAATLALPARHGWRVPAHHASTREEWDDYERHYAATMRAWLAAHPDDGDAPAFRERIETWAGAYERWGHDTMGFVTLVLHRDA